MSIEGKKTLGQALEDPCTAAALVSTSTSPVFELQDDPTPQTGCSCHYGHVFTMESSSEELDEDIETVVNILKEDDSAGQSPEPGTCAKLTTKAVMEKLEEKPNEMEKPEACKGAGASIQGGQPQDSDLDMRTAGADRKASKSSTGVLGTQVRWELTFQITIWNIQNPGSQLNSHAFPITLPSIRNVPEGMFPPVSCLGIDSS